MKRSSNLSVAMERVAWAGGAALLLAYAAAQWHFARSHQAGLQEFAAALAQSRDTHIEAFVGLEAGGRGLVLQPLDWQSPAAAELQVGRLQIEPMTLSRAKVEQPVSSSIDLKRHEPTLMALEPPMLLVAAAPDKGSWSAGRIAAFEAGHDSTTPRAVLRIPSIGLAVPIYAGVTESNLNRGAAWIDATAPLGSPGNTGLAAHRDGYFRALRDVAVGDRIELQTLQRTLTYAVEEIQIVAPSATHVLAPSTDERLTLVTCYPFFMIGPAPKRYVVRARAAAVQTETHANAATPTG